MAEADEEGGSDEVDYVGDIFVIGHNLWKSKSEAKNTYKT